MRVIYLVGNKNNFQLILLRHGIEGGTCYFVEKIEPVTDVSNVVKEYLSILEEVSSLIKIQRQDLQEYKKIARMHCKKEAQ